MILDTLDSWALYNKAVRVAEVKTVQQARVAVRWLAKAEKMCYSQVAELEIWKLRWDLQTRFSNFYKEN